MPPKTVDIDTHIEAWNAIGEEMKETLVERDRTIHLLKLSIPARTHILAIGEGGVAKTLAADLLHSHIEGAKRCYVMCSKTMPPEVLVGNLSIKSLVEDDVVDYNVEGHLPTAHIASLDEIFKLNAVVANMLLSILNERRFTTGRGVIECPLWSCIGTSNMDEYRIGGDLAAFRDRFGAAIIERPVSTDDGFKRVLRGQSERYAADERIPKAKTTITLEGVVALQDACRRIVHPVEVEDALTEIWRKAAGESLNPSVRRFGQLQQNMAAQALLRGDTATNVQDCALAQDMLWTDHEDYEKAVAIAIAYAGRAITKAHELRESLQPEQDHIKELQGLQDPNTGQLPPDQYARVAAISRNLRAVEDAVRHEIEKVKVGEDDTELGQVLDDTTIARQAVAAFMGM